MVYNMSYFAMNMIVLRDRNLFFAVVVLVWVLLGLMGDEWFWDGRGWGWRIEGRGLGFGVVVEGLGFEGLGLRG